MARIVETVHNPTQAVIAPADGLKPEQASDAQSRMNHCMPQSPDG